MWSDMYFRAQARHQRERFCRFGIQLCYLFFSFIVHTHFFRLKMEWKSFVWCNCEYFSSTISHFACEFHCRVGVYSLQLNKSCIKLCDRLLIVLWFLMFYLCVDFHYHHAQQNEIRQSKMKWVSAKEKKLMKVNLKFIWV